MARLLIVDDNQTIRFLMRSYLEGGGHIICGEAKNGMEGVELAKQTVPDVILLDLTMPELSGIETAAILKRTLPQIPIILFTLHEESINQELAATMGVDLVVNKIDGVPRVAESVKALLERAAPNKPGTRLKDAGGVDSTEGPRGKGKDVN